MLVRRMKGKIRVLDPTDEDQSPAGAIFEITLSGASAIATREPAAAAIDTPARESCSTP
jgi:hypothetical protein